MGSMRLTQGTELPSKSQHDLANYLQFTTKTAHLEKAVNPRNLHCYPLISCYETYIPSEEPVNVLHGECRLRLVSSITVRPTTSYNILVSTAINPQHLHRL